MQHVQIADRRIIWPAGHSPASALVFAQNTVEISASPHQVWSLLIDCVDWPRWYKHCSDVSILRGGPLLDANAKFRFKTLGFYFEPEIETFEPYRMLVWSAKGPAGTSGSHAWYIDPTPGGCRVITEESQKGLLLLLRRSQMRTRLLASHEEWVRSLKEIAEMRQSTATH
jgi:hypothetical protein